MAMPDFEQIRQLGDFAVTDKWDISIIPPAGVNIDGEFLNLRCSAVSPTPKVSNTPLVSNIRGHKAHQPGQAQYTESITLTLTETSDMQVLDAITQWYKLCQDPITRYSSRKLETMGTIILKRLNRQNEPVYTYIIKGAFLTDYDPGSFMSDSQIIQPTLTLTYDYFDEER